MTASFLFYDLETFGADPRRTRIAQFAAIRTDADVVDRWLFSGNRPLVRDVEVAGVRVVQDGRHRDRAAIATRYRTAMQALLL